VWTISSVPRIFVAVLLRTIGKTDSDDKKKLAPVNRAAFFLPPTNNSNAAVEISLVATLGAHF
jgi:hypothetical protein